MLWSNHFPEQRGFWEESCLSPCSQVSGLSRWLGAQMTPLHSVPAWAIAIIVCLLIATFTECTSNVATATLFLPVLASLVTVAGVSRMPTAWLWSAQRKSRFCFVFWSSPSPSA